MHAVVLAGQHLLALILVWNISQDLCLSVQVQNASDLLIKPLEKFRKEQLGVTKVSLEWLSVEANGDTTFNTFLTYLHRPADVRSHLFKPMCESFAWVTALHLTPLPPWLTPWSLECLVVWGDAHVCWNTSIYILFSKSPVNSVCSHLDCIISAFCLVVLRWRIRVFPSSVFIKQLHPCAKSLIDSKNFSFLYV